MIVIVLLSLSPTLVVVLYVCNNFQLWFVSSADYGRDGDPTDMLPRYHARLEARCYGNMEEVRFLWDDIMTRHGREAQYWLEYAELERFVSDCPSVHLSVCLNVCLCVCLSEYLSGSSVVITLIQITMYIYSTCKTSLIHTHMYAHTRTHMYTHAHTHTHTHTHTRTRTQVLWRC